MDGAPILELSPSLRGEQAVRGSRSGAGGGSPPEAQEMVSLSGPRFRVASEQFYPEDAPVRDVELGPLAIDRHP